MRETPHHPASPEQPRWRPLTPPPLQPRDPEGPEQRRERVANERGLEMIQIARADDNRAGERRARDQTPEGGSPLVRRRHAAHIILQRLSSATTEAPETETRRLPDGRMPTDFVRKRCPAPSAPILAAPSPSGTRSRPAPAGSDAWIGTATGSTRSEPGVFRTAAADQSQRACR